MKYLNDFFYADLSQQAKLGGTGLSSGAHFLLDEIRSLPGTDSQIKKYRYSQIGQGVALVLALASEIEAHFNFGLRNGRSLCLESCGTSDRCGERGV